MPDQERDAAAFERWLEERLGSHVSPCHCDAVAESAWHAAIASVQPERAAAGVLSLAADALTDALYSVGALVPDLAPLAHALDDALAAYDAARAGAGETA